MKPCIGFFDLVHPAFVGNLLPQFPTVGCNSTGRSYSGCNALLFRLITLLNKKHLHGLKQNQLTNHKRLRKPYYELRLGNAKNQHQSNPHSEGPGSETFVKGVLNCTPQNQIQLIDFTWWRSDYAYHVGVCHTKRYGYRAKYKLSMILFSSRGWEGMTRPLLSTFSYLLDFSTCNWSFQSQSSKYFCMLKPSSTVAPRITLYMWFASATM
jgi:hypothetical protein